MKKLIILPLLLGAAIFAAIFFLSPPKSDSDFLKKALCDHYSSFKSLADYLTADPSVTFIDDKDAKKNEDIKEDYNTVNEAGILSISSKNGLVIFNTGYQPNTSSEQYIIYSPKGKPADYPDAFDAGKDGWYLAEGKKQ